jgi:hypothetical protein
MNGQDGTIFTGEMKKLIAVLYSSHLFLATSMIVVLTAFAGLALCT